MAVVVMVVLVVEMLKVNSASACVLSLYIVSVLILLYRKMRPGADVADMPMIPAFGEILVRADGADDARPPLSSTHYGLQRRCGAMNRKAVCKTVTGQAGHRLASCHPPGPQGR